MGKKTDDLWSDFTGDFTQMSISDTKKYLEKCKDFLVEVSSEAKTDVKYSAQGLNNGFVLKSWIGMYDNDVRHAHEFTCAICSKPAIVNESGKVLVANPFTRAQNILVCDMCST